MYCVQKNVGGTVGWRLPSVVELKEVVAPFVPHRARLPASRQDSFLHWSATTFALLPSAAWHVELLRQRRPRFGRDKNEQVNSAWCVRGPNERGLVLKLRMSTFTLQMRPRTACAASFVE